MAKKLETYNAKPINEFVDWVSGENSLTGGNDTENLPVSGARIRELLLSRLKHPVHVERYKDEHLYRIFSSEDAKGAWERTKDDKLVIASFVAPSEYVIDVVLKSKQSNYVRYGIEGLEGTVIRYSWKTANDKGNVFSENVSVTYKNTTNGKGDSEIISPSGEDENIIEKDVYKWLDLGTNRLKISFKGITTGAELEMDIIITTVQFTINTSLDYTKILTNGNPLVFDLYADRNVVGPLSFKTKRCYYGSKEFDNSESVSETVSSSKNIQINQQNSLSPSTSYGEIGEESLINIKSRLHSVLVWGEMEIDSKLFHSNLIYYLIAGGLANNESVGTQADGITLKYEFNDRIDLINPGEFSMIATLYEAMSFDWAYITYVDSTKANISWLLREIDTEEPSNSTETFINTYQCSPNIQAPTFNFIPTTYTAPGKKTYLVAYIDYNSNQTLDGNEREIIAIPITIFESTLGIGETGGANLKLKLSAFGRQNIGENVDSWLYGDYYTTFRGMKWNNASGWDNNAFNISGRDSLATINFNPFYNVDPTSKGITIEIDFESTLVSSNNDELIRLGGSDPRQAHISIYPNRAQLFTNNADENSENLPIITTNYKSNERVKLAFIIEPRNGVSDELKNVIFIVNNGIVERAAGWKSLEPSAFILQNSSDGNIRIGKRTIIDSLTNQITLLGIASGVKVYNIRCYSTAITILDAYNNYVYDSDNKAEIVANNNIYTAGVIDMNKCQSKGDVIIIKGNLNKILDRKTTKDGSNSSCDIERRCISDPSKNFVVTHGRIRKHGQSTLNYPLTSYKLWTWSSVDETRPTLSVDASETLPFTKNRYLMKNDSIPANKFVLQANYADSSGVHNGGFERLIQESWYNAKFKVGTSDEYKLRTPPQLFSSNQVISLQEGDTTENLEIINIFRGYNTEGRLWRDYFGENRFPYTIRNSPDSFPCLVFYQNEEAGDTAPKFLGLYVFMDDKKSDFVYGERSIYKVLNSLNQTDNANDPFCVRSNAEGTELWDEKQGVKVWDNDKVLRIEVLSVNSTLADYRGEYTDNSHRRFDDVILGDSDTNTSIGWEEDFELVYPEKEEITTKKAFDAQKFVNTVKPFTDWLEWIISTKNDHAKFRREATTHLDLYKMAAYYIFVLRFGLVDSLERNAQIKTYDGQHFHYEPWDMDIALGNRNTGGIAFDPPIDRTTMMDNTTAAISGRSVIDTNNDTIPDTMVSNWLWDALEAWPHWIDEIVPEVAGALFDAGLTYNNVIKMLDENYQSAWSESIYNESGNFKYVLNRQNTDDNGNILPGYNDGWLAWLQGARTTHRHWWLRTSMDYYDAKWGVGEFKQRNMYIACEMHNVQGTLDLIPTSDTYFAFLREATKFGPYSAPTSTGLLFDMSVINSGAKVPFTIFGANFIKEIDISDIASGLQVFGIANAYSSEVGPVITKVNIGVHITTENETHLEGGMNGKDLTIEAGNALNAIEELNVRGQKGDKQALDLSFLSNTKTIKVLKAAGSGLRALISAVGTDYDTLELPVGLTSITFNSTTWDTSKLSFWTLTEGQTVTRTYTQEATDEEGNIIYEEDGVTPVMEEYQVTEFTTSQYDKYDLNDVNIRTSIPRSLTTVRFTGTTGRNACARQFVVDWINSIIKWGTDDWNNNVNDIQNQTQVIENAQGEEETVIKYANLNAYLESLFKVRNLSVENIYWDNVSIPGLSLEQLHWISCFNDINYSQIPSPHPNIANFASGYIRVIDSTQISGIQASQLTTWFGNGVFRLNSGGLVIDQALENYTAISVGNPAYIVHNSQTDEDEIHLKEGSTAQITATKFRLQLNLDLTSFTLAAPGSTIYSPIYSYPNNETACAIQSQVIGLNYFYFLVTYPNSTGESYNVDLISGASRLTIHIDPLDYPDEEILSIGDCTKVSDAGSSIGEYAYYKDADIFVIGTTGVKEFGISFKDVDALGRTIYPRTPQNLETKVEYVKFRLYKEGTLCSAFDLYGFDYNYFTQGANIETLYVNSGDTNLAYLKGSSLTSNHGYNYFIKFLVISVPRDPVLYELVVDIKLGGKIEELRLKFILVQDGDVAQQGSPLWGMLNNSYVELFNHDFTNNFTKSIAYILTGNISVDGHYQEGVSIVNVIDHLDLVTNLLGGTQSVFKYLPNITGIKLDGITVPSSFTENNIEYTNLDISNCTKLQRFSILNCTGLTEDISLTHCPNITEVDASGTNINVLVPANAPLTKYELGTPTTVNLTSPTVLLPSGVQVDNASSITSIDIVNIPNNKSFTMFDKVTTNTVVQS